MMTHLRYWSPVGFLLLAFAVSAGMSDFSSKWSHVVVGILALPLAWSLHYVCKQQRSFRDPALWAGALLVGTLASALGAGNAYAGLLGWFSLVAAVVFFVGVRSLTAEHRPVFQIGLVSIGVLWVSWSLLATKTSLTLPWVPALAKHAVPFAALAIVPLAAAVLLFKRQAAWKNALLAAACIVLVVPFVLPSFGTSVREQWHTTVALAPSVVKMTAAHPWLGVGAGNAQYLYPRFSTNRTIILQQAPSSVQDMLSSYGLVGVALLIGVLIASLLGLRHQSRRTRFVLVLAVIATQVLCWVANLWQYPALWWSWWALLGLCASPLATSEVQDASTRRSLRNAALTLCALIALQAMVMSLGLNRFAAADRAALSGDTKTAAKLYRQSLRFDPDPEQRRAYAESLWLNTYQNKDLGTAEQQARLAYQWNRDDAFARQVAARVSFSQGKNAEAERLYRETLDRDPYFSLDAYVALADVFKKQGKVADERATLQEGLAKYPATPTLADVAYPTFLEQLKQMRTRVEALPKPTEDFRVY